MVCNGRGAIVWLKEHRLKRLRVLCCPDLLTCVIKKCLISTRLPVSHILLNQAAAHNGTTCHLLADKISFPLFAALVDVVTDCIVLLCLRLMEWVVFLLLI